MTMPRNPRQRAALIQKRARKAAKARARHAAWKRENNIRRNRPGARQRATPPPRFNAGKIANFIKGWQ